MTLHSNIKLIPKSINFVGLNCFFLLRLFPRIFSVSKFLVSFGEMMTKKYFQKFSRGSRKKNENPKILVFPHVKGFVKPYFFAENQIGMPFDDRLITV